MDSLFVWESSSNLYCYLPVERLQRASQDTKVVDALIKHLKVPGKPEHLKRFSLEEKREAIVKQLENLRDQKTSHWYKQPLLEILAGELRACELPVATKNAFWPAVKKEADLTGTVALHFRAKGSVFKEIPMGKNRVDLLVHVKGFLSDDWIGIELKNDLTELKKGIDQLDTYQNYTTHTYLACTPALAAEYLLSHAAARGVTRWDPDVLSDKLERTKAGLLLVEANSVRVAHDTSVRSVSSKKIDELKPFLVSKNMI